MNRSAQLTLAAAIAISAATFAYAQANSRPTPDPVVTAQNESWYLNGDPVMYEGNIYYPAGPRTYFNRYEMVRSGYFRGIPIYTRTTIEPYSMVFVPIGGGLMQPYERRRAGDIAGTVGSTAPSFLVAVPSEPERETATLLPEMLQAAAPPTSLERHLAEPCRHVVHRARWSHGGMLRRHLEPTPPPALQPMRSAKRPEGLNAAFVDFDGQRYLNSGVPVLLGRGRFERVGEHRGLPVYTRDGDTRTIYIPVQRDAELVAPYSRRSPNPRSRAPNPQPPAVPTRTSVLL